MSRASGVGVEAPVIEIREVGKDFAGVPALDRVTLDVATGETLALLGPSGCGKSTLLRVLVGLLAPDAGHVRVLGLEVRAEHFPEIRRRTGYVIQEGGLFPHLTARENLELAVRQQGWDDGRIARRLDELLDLVRLSSDLLPRWPRELSGGQRQRIALARALMLDPELLLLDEPLGALDPLVRAELQEELRAIFARLGKTVVLVTHDLPEARHFAHRVALLVEGRLVQVGSAEELLERPADEWVQRFVDAQRTLWW